LYRQSDLLKDFAWPDTFESKAFKDLSHNKQQIILNKVNAEKDRYSNNSINPNKTVPKCELVANQKITT
jgi:hypothetical protein